MKIVLFGAGGKMDRGSQEICAKQISLLSMSKSAKKEEQNCLKI